MKTLFSSIPSGSNLGARSLAEILSLSVDQSKEVRSLHRLCKDRDDRKQTQSFDRDDLLTVAKVVDMAHTWIFDQAA